MTQPDMQEVSGNRLPFHSDAVSFDQGPRAQLDRESHRFERRRGRQLTDCLQQRVHAHDSSIIVPLRQLEE